MKRLVVIALFGLLSSGAAFAQQPAPAPAPSDQVVFLSKALAALQQQRNAAMDDAINAQAISAMLREQVAALQEQVSKLKASQAEPQKEPDK